ncbi:hypothetical protein FAGKG844_160067 [Frankia sp. AgKG'84/4]
MSAGVLVFSTLSCRPFRTSCWIVGNAAPVPVTPRRTALGNQTGPPAYLRFLRDPYREPPCRLQSLLPTHAVGCVALSQ